MFGKGLSCREDKQGEMLPGTRDFAGDHLWQRLTRVCEPAVQFEHMLIFARLNDRFVLRKEPIDQLDRLHIFGSVRVKEVLRHIAKLGGLCGLNLSRIKSALHRTASSGSWEQLTLTQSLNVRDKAFVKRFEACRKLSCNKEKDHTLVGEHRQGIA